MKNWKVGIAIAGILMLATTGAMAQENSSPKDGEPRLFTEYGMAFTVGGGINDFTDDSARDFTEAGGQWEARYIFGTRQRVGAEAAYVGTLNGLDALGVEQDARLVSNGIEGAVRVNILTGEFQPFVVGGLGWKHYEVSNTTFNTSAIRDSDDALTVPLGAGFAYRYSNLIVDVRANFKPSFAADITRTGGDDDTDLNTYGAQANVGFEF